MPPLKKKRRVSCFKEKGEIRNEALSHKPQKKSSNEQQTYEVAEILSCRLDPETTKVNLQFLVSWNNYGPESNSYEPLDSLRLNTVFINYINEKFKEFEADIFVNIANIKEKIKFKRRKALNEDLKVVIMMQKVFPFDPFEYKVHQVIFHTMIDPPKKYKAYLEDLVFRNHFFKLDEVQRIKQDKLAKEISEKEGFPVIVENDVDFEPPPEFNYINKNIFTDELMIANETMLNQTLQSELDSTSAITGCKCGDKCNKDSTICCPKLLKLPFAYKENRHCKVVRLLRQEPIIECCDNCLCDKDCLNRVTQQKRNLSLCLFKTENRGWGVKTLAQIRRGVFILEYTGELMGNVEAGKRPENAYLFDLNMDRLNHGFYTIDAFHYGNLARFVNHSCDPNSSIWIVSDCTKNPKSQKLCIFALRQIEKDEEITIDYSPVESVPTSDRMNASRTYYVECHCGSKACRGTIFLNA
ncbi:histone-lysine N-methyltransferase SUV39H1-A-like [Chironomus tepperi]|uniref:histone-lysine N-methyltransferase SUV39H1-A-like n=1 Tax=Chironomus tepperi TaxID=113505 RepID=UPI00391F36C3